MSTHDEYDLSGRRTATIRPLGQRSETHYDAQGRTSYELDAEGNRTDYNYDPLTGWLSEKTYTLGEESTAAPTAPVSYTYWPDGQVKDITDGRGTTHHEYDAQGRLQSRIDPDGAKIAYEYDEAGNRTETRTYLPDSEGAPQLIGTTDYTFDAQGRLKTVDDAAIGTTTYFYDTASNLIRTDLPNGVIETRAYDWQNRLKELKNLGPDSSPENLANNPVLSSYTYERDLAGKITHVAEQTLAPGASTLTTRTADYHYDDLNRLDRETVNAGLSGATEDRYFYDLVGNRLRKESWRDNPATTSAVDLVLDSATDYAYDANDRLTSETTGSNVTTYGYDANGSQTRRTQNAADQVFYRWDAEHRLVAADLDADGDWDATYQYNDGGLRVSRTEPGPSGSLTTRSLLDTSLPNTEAVVEYAPPSSGVSAEAQARFVAGNDLFVQVRFDQGATPVVSVYLHDFHSGIRELVDDTGAITDAYIYDAFGVLVGSSGTSQNDRFYRGEQWFAALGIYDTGQRGYGPTAGRFLSVDPFAGDFATPYTLHRYGYSHGDPVNFADPTGMSDFSLGGMLTSMGIGGVISGTLNAGISAARGQSQREIVKSFATGFLVGAAINGAVYGAAWWLYARMLAGLATGSAAAAVEGVYALEATATLAGETGTWLHYANHVIRLEKVAYLFNRAGGAQALAKAGYYADDAAEIAGTAIKAAEKSAQLNSALANGTLTQVGEKGVEVLVTLPARGTGLPMVLRTFWIVERFTTSSGSQVLAKLTSWIPKS